MTLPPRRVGAAKTNPKTSERTVGEETKLLLSMLEQLRDDFQDERNASRESRAKLHERMNEVANDVGAIKGDIRILGEVDGQVRGELQALKATVENHHAETKPTVDAWRDMIKTGRRITIIMGIAGLSFAGILTGIFTWFGDTLPAVIKSWLRLG